MPEIKNVLITYYQRYKLYFQSASLYLFASLFSAGVKMLINPLMARNLSYEDYAIVGYFTSFSALFMPLLNFSVITYYLSKYYTFSEEKRLKVINTVLTTLVGIGVIFSVIILVAFYAYMQIEEVNFNFWPFAYFVVFQLVFTNFLTMLQVTYRVRREAKKFANLTVISSLIWVAFAIVFVVMLKLGASGSMGANLLVSILIGVYCYKKMIGKMEFDRAIFWDAMKFCWPLTLSAILWYFLSSVDRVFLEKINDTKSFALYNIGMVLSGFIAIFYTAISQTFEPDMYKAIADKKIKKLINIILGIVGINAIPVVLFILFATPLTHILTGGRYTDAAFFAKILSLKNLTTSLYYSVITVIVGYGYTKSELGLRAVGAVGCILLYKFLIQQYGFVGAAWGQVLSFFMMALLGAGFILMKFKFKKPSSPLPNEIVNNETNNFEL